MDYRYDPGDDMHSDVIEAKAFWASRLFWLGAAEIAYGLLSLVLTTMGVSERVVAWGAILAGALTIVFRMLTKRPLALKTGALVAIRRLDP